MKGKYASTQRVSAVAGKGGWGVRCEDWCALLQRVRVWKQVTLFTKEEGYAELNARRKKIKNEENEEVRNRGQRRDGGSVG